MFSWFGFGMPLEERLKLIANAGFSATCLWFGQEEEMVKNAQADRMPELAHETGLTLDNIHLPFHNCNYLWSTFPEENIVIRKEISEGILFCHKHRIPLMVMHPVSGKTPPPHNPGGLKILQDVINFAEDRNVIIAMENIWSAGNTYLDYVFSNIQSPNLGFCYDSSHDNIARVFKKKALEKWGHLLATTHISDNFSIDDDHLIPGRGSIDWPALMKQFPKGYKGTLMLEVDGPEAGKGFTAKDFLATAYQSSRELARMLEQFT